MATYYLINRLDTESALARLVFQFLLYADEGDADLWPKVFNTSGTVQYHLETVAIQLNKSIKARALERGTTRQLASNLIVTPGSDGLSASVKGYVTVWRQLAPAGQPCEPALILPFAAKASRSEVSQCLLAHCHAAKPPANRTRVFLPAGRFGGAVEAGLLGVWGGRDDHARASEVVAIIRIQPPPAQFVSQAAPLTTAAAGCS